MRFFIHQDKEDQPLSHTKQHEDSSKQILQSFLFMPYSADSWPALFVLRLISNHSRFFYLQGPLVRVERSLNAERQGQLIAGVADG